MSSTYRCPFVCEGPDNTKIRVTNLTMYDASQSGIIINITTIGNDNLDFTATNLLLLNETLSPTSSSIPP